MKTILKLFGGLIAACGVLVAGAVLVLNTDVFQNRLLRHATRLLSDKLQTRVEIDSISIGLFSQDVNLYGLDVEDRQHRKMLQLDRLSVNVKLLALLHDEVLITDASIDGFRAQLYKPSPDSVANYQFVIDAFKKDSVPPAERPPVDSLKKKKLTVNLNQLSVSHVNVTYNDQAYTLLNMMYQKRSHDRQSATVTGLQRSWVSQTKKGPVDNRLRIGTLLLTEANGHRRADIDSLHFVTDNHLPRKNTGKPKRGAFDVGHFDIVANLKADINSIQGDSIIATITQCGAIDRGSGLMLKTLKAKVLVSKGIAYLNDVTIQLPNTNLQFASGSIQLPSKKLNRPLAYSTSPITGRVVLKDISRPFAPVLANFVEPLLLQVRLSGSADDMTFQNVSVGTPDKKLAISASGSITGLKDKYKLAVRFHVGKMTAQGGVKERIISQFPVKKFMMKQLHNLGTIHYTGDFSVLYKKEAFQGLLQTAAGRLDVNFMLDELNKYVYGTARTDSFMLGQVMDMPDIGMIACKTSFKFDISKPRTAIMRRQKGGKLPIGQVDAEVYEASFKKVKVRNIIATMQSDGAIAEGNLTMKGSRVDVLCSFSFTNTNEMRKTKIKPGLKFHKLSAEKKAAKEERKKQKAEEKALRKQQKAEEKTLRKQQKAEEKAARKAAKKAAKEERKRQKEASL